MINDQEVKADLIEVVESGAFTTEHIFQSGEAVLGVLSLKGGKSAGTFRIPAGQEYTFKKTSPWKSHYTWKEGDLPTASAESPGAFRRAFQIDYEGTAYGLFPGGSKFRSWHMKDLMERNLCEISPRGAFKRGARIRIMAEIPLGVLVFAYCLVNKRWQEESS